MSLSLFPLRLLRRKLSPVVGAIGFYRRDLLLLFLGLVMVFSASSVVAFAYKGSALAIVSKQAVWVVIGLTLGPPEAGPTRRLWGGAAGGLTEQACIRGQRAL